VTGRRAPYISPSMMRLPMKESLAHKMRVVSRLVMRNLEERIARYGITQGMWFYLRVLWENDGISQKELSARTGVVGPSTVGAMARMEAMGLIARRRDGADGRVSRVHLTARGKKLERTLVPIAIGVINRAVAGLPRADVDRLKATLDRIKANLECVSPPSSARRRSRASGP
jgi:MarR family transcriptional regulator, organic hydroperoxide resistance regulator